jgi:hypothetical protein
MPRYIVELPMMYRCHVTAAHPVEATDKARRTMMDTDFGSAIKKVLPFDVHAQVTFGGPPKVEEVSVDDLNRLDDPQERLHAVYVRCFKHGGPRMPFDDITAAIARTAYAAIPAGPDKLRAHAAFDDFGVDLGVAICAPAIFTGEWFGFENNTYGLGIRGFDNGQRWNGWACPLFPLKGMIAIVEWQDAQPKESLEGMDQIVVTAEAGVSRVWMQHCPDNGGELIEILPSVHETTQGPQTLYGAGDGWCWEAFTKDYPEFKVLAG